jgi:hypothetical protein
MMALLSPETGLASPQIHSRFSNVNCFTSHAHLMMRWTIFRRSFGLRLDRSPSRHHRTMERLLRTVVDQVLPVLLEDLAWNRMCQIASSIRLACCKLFLSWYLAMSAYLGRRADWENET